MTSRQIPDFDIIERQIQNMPLLSDDVLAQQEKAIAFNHKDRGERYKRHIHICFTIGIYVISAIILALVISRVWHVVAPCDLCWLSESKLHDIERVLFSTVFLSFMTKHFRKYDVV